MASGVAKKFILHTVVISTATPIQINQCKDFDISPSLAKFFEYGSGSVDPTFAGIDSELPILRVSSTAVQKILDGISTTAGLAIGGTVTVKFYFQQADAGGTRKSGSTGFCLTGSLGIAVIDGISAQGGQTFQPAVADVLFYLASTDGETAPLTYTGSVALPTLAATDQLFTVGPATLNGTEIGAIESFRFSPNLQVNRNRGDGQPYPTFVFIMRRGNEQEGPGIQVTTKHIDALTATTTSITSATTSIFLRAMKAGGTRELVTALTHIKFVPAGGLAIVQNISGSDGGEAGLAIDFAAVGAPAWAVTTLQQISA